MDSNLFAISHSGFQQDQKDEIYRLAGRLDITVRDTFEPSAVKCVVSKSMIGFEGCQAAVAAKIPVVNMKWLEESEAQSQILPFGPYVMKPLEGYKIFVTGFSGSNRREIKRMCEDLGATHSSKLDKTCTHLIAESPGGEDCEFAQMHKIVVMGREWLTETQKLKYPPSFPSMPDVQTVSGEASTLMAPNHPDADQIRGGTEKFHVGRRVPPPKKVVQESSNFHEGQPTPTRKHLGKHSLQQEEENDKQAHKKGKLVAHKDETDSEDSETHIETQVSKEKTSTKTSKTQDTKSSTAKKLQKSHSQTEVDPHVLAAGETVHTILSIAGKPVMRTELTAQAKEQSDTQFSDEQLQNGIEFGFSTKLFKQQVGHKLNPAWVPTRKPNGKSILEDLIEFMRKDDRWYTREELVALKHSQGNSAQAIRNKLRDHSIKIELQDHSRPLLQAPVITLCQKDKSLRCMQQLGASSSSPAGPDVTNVQTSSTTDSELQDLRTENEILSQQLSELQCHIDVHSSISHLNSLLQKATHPPTNFNFLKIAELRDLDLDSVHKISQGCCGVVSSVTTQSRPGFHMNLIPAGIQVAIKALHNYASRKMQNPTVQQQNKFEKEYAFGISLPHWSILAVFNYFRSAFVPKLFDGADHSLYTDTTTYLVLELASNTLEGHLKSLSSPVPPHDAALIALSILHGLCHLESHGIFHMDLKIDNVFEVPCRGGLGTIFVVGDLGTAILAPNGLFVRPDGHGVPEGNILNRAPEVLRPKEGPIPIAKSDVWALGCILFQMVHGQHPFAGDYVQDQICSGCVRFPPAAESELLHLQGIIGSLLASDPAVRPTAKQACDQIEAYLFETGVPPVERARVLLAEIHPEGADITEVRFHVKHFLEMLYLLRVLKK